MNIKDIFKKKDKHKEEEFIISEPTAFNSTISLKLEQAVNPFAKFDGKGEKALIPLELPITLLNKRTITSPKDYFDLIDEMNKLIKETEKAKDKLEENKKAKGEA